MNSLVYCKPMKRFKNRSDMMKFWSTSDGTGSRIENKLKTVSLSRWKTKQKRVAIVDFGVSSKADFKSDSWQ